MTSEETQPRSLFFSSSYRDGNMKSDAERGKWNAHCAHYGLQSWSGVHRQVPRSALGSPMHAVFVRLFSTQPESHVCGLPCVICSTAVLEGKYCFSFLQLRWFARLITFSKDHVTGKRDKLNSSQGPPVYSERLSIKHLDHSPSRVPKVRGPFRTTTSSLEIRRNILMPWRIYLSQKPQRKI